MMAVFFTQLISQAPTPDWAKTVSELGLSALLILGFSLFIWGIYTDRLVTGNRHQDTINYHNNRHQQTIDHYKETLAGRDEEIKELKSENRAYRAENADKNQQIVRLADDYKTIVRDVISTRLAAISSPPEGRA